MQCTVPLVYAVDLVLLLILYLRNYKGSAAPDQISILCAQYYD